MAFQRMLLDEEKQQQKRDIISVSMSNDDMVWLVDGKKLLGLQNNSTALKTLAVIGKNVIQNTFNHEILNLLFKKNGKNF